MTFTVCVTDCDLEKSFSLMRRIGCVIVCALQFVHLFYFLSDVCDLERLKNLK